MDSAGYLRFPATSSSPVNRQALEIFERLKAPCSGLTRGDWFRLDHEPGERVPRMIKRWPVTTIPERPRFDDLFFGAVVESSLAKPRFLRCDWLAAAVEKLPQ